MKISFRLSILLLFALLGINTKIFSQSLPPLQPEQDPCNAIQLCGNSFYTLPRYTGPGATTSFLGCVTETASMWIKVQVATAGTIVFTITPNNQYDDYDFAVVDATGVNCNNITSANVIRCNANNNNAGSTPGGIIGLNTTSTLTNVPGGTFGSPFCQQITATAGQIFMVMIDCAGNYANPSTTSSGFTIDFSGSTATFVGSAPPLFDTIAFSCDYRNGLTFHITNPAKCSSLQANGSDFYITPAAATVASSTGAGCTTPASTTQDITVTFSNPLPPGTYWLHAKNGTDANTLVGQCNGLQPLTDSIQFRVEDPLVVNAGIDTITCIGNSLQLNGSFTGGPFLSTSVVWSPATYLNNNTILNPISTPTADVTYVLTVTPNGKAQCAKQATVHVAVLQGFDLLNHDTVICKGASVQMVNTGDSRYTYVWTPSTYLSNTGIASPTSTPDTSISYTVTASHAGCRDSVRHISIEVQPNPIVYIGPDITLCYNDTLHMNPSVTPTWYQNYSYSWDPPLMFDNASDKNAVFTAQSNATLTLTVTTTAGCTGSDSRDITVVPADFSSVSNDTGICPRASAQLHVVGGLSYQWLPNLYVDNNLSADPIVSPLATTTYTVYAVDQFGCKDTQQVKVTVFPEAMISMPDTVLIYAGEHYTLDPQGNCLYFQWFPYAGLSYNNIANPVATPDVNTRYFVTGTTEAGCVTYDSIDVRVSYMSLIDVPNAFSPGSGPNNLLKPVYKGMVSLNAFRIFDRWGKKVYESKNLNEGWDGTLNGVPQPLGVYVYTLEATLPGGRTVNKNGNVTLLR